MAINRTQQARQMLKKRTKPVVQGGVDNYLGKQPQVVAPRKWQSGPNKPPTELAYITEAEKKLLLKEDIHGSLKDGPNKGPAGIMSLDSFGDIGGAGAAGVDTDPGGGAMEGRGFSGRGPGETKSAFDARVRNQKEIMQKAEQRQAERLGFRERKNIIDRARPGRFGFNPLATLLGFVNPVLGFATRGIMGIPDVAKKFKSSNTLVDFLNKLKTPTGATTDQDDTTLLDQVDSDLPFAQSYLQQLQNKMPTNLNDYQGLTNLDFINRVSERDMSLTPEQRQLIEDEQIDDIRGIMAADGGRIGLQEGGGIEQRLEQLGGDVTSAEKMLQGINQRLKTAESSLSSGGRGPGGLGTLANMASSTPGVGATASAIFSSSPLANIPLPGSPGVPDLNKFNEIKDIFMGNMSPGKPGSLIPLEENPNFQNIPEQFRSGFANYLKENPNSFGFGGQMMSSVGLPGGGGVTFGDTGSAKAFRDYLESTGFTPPSPLAVPTLSPLGVDNMGFNFRQEGDMGRYVADNDPGQQFAGYSSYQDYLNAGNDPVPRRQGPQSLLAAGVRNSGIPAAGYADGGVIGGGIMDAAGRQQYFLGKLVKKAKRAVKKIVKSPVGKLGIGAALLGGLTPGGFKGLGKFILKNKELAGAAGLIAAPFIFGQEEQQQPTGFTGPVGGKIDPRAYTDPYGVLYSAFRADGSPKEGEKGNMKVAGYLDPMSEKNDMAMEMFGKQLKDLTDDELELLDEEIDRLRSKFMADGGSTEKEPVAKKTMPLLDMGGQEMDLRDNGGFVPIGRMEKADDVPARLSKNEFVFTADAVRNAGDGDVDKGAEVMYNMMKNLEAGGDVSEESQGLKGARKMFQTSQRLEEVL